MHVIAMKNRTHLNPNCVCLTQKPKKSESMFSSLFKVAKIDIRKSCKCVVVHVSNV